MGTGRTLRKESHVRPCKTPAGKARKSKAQRARLVKMGMDPETVAKRLSPRWAPRTSAFSSSVRRSSRSSSPRRRNKSASSQVRSAAFALFDRRGAFLFYGKDIVIKVFCNIADALVDSLFEVFDGGDFILSSYHDIEEPDTQMQVYLSDPAQADEAARRLKDALALVGSNAQVGASEVPDEDWKLSYRRHFKIEPIGRRLVTVPTWELEGFKESSEFSDRIPLVLDPGMAFGTGKHETTRACLSPVSTSTRTQSMRPARMPRLTEFPSTTAFLRSGRAR